ncbi:hypothetical protein [Altererythrobacter sp. Z27]|uniref:hypothetical protein n=1 Tax=Altererythrobacter sp. Z27 TaxID=3461147 RepID=UPI004043F0F5
MTALLILVLLVLMALVVFSLVRGIVAFLKTTKIDLESGDGENVKEMQLMQNRAMFARIKYQGLAVAVIAVILAISQ